MARTCRYSSAVLGRVAVCIMVFLLVPVVSTQAQQQGAGFDPLYLYYGAKLVPAGLFLGTAITDPDLETTERAVVTAGALAVGLSSAGVLLHAIRGNPRATRGFRIAAVAADLAVTAGVIAWGVHLIRDGSPGQDLAGLAVVSIGSAGLLVAGLNLVPLRTERIAVTQYP